MNKELTPVQKLDKILNHLELTKFYTFLEIAKNFDYPDFPKTYYPEIDEILNYLIEEKYVLKQKDIVKIETPTSSHFRLTYKGYIFKKEGAYTTYFQKARLKRRIQNLKDWLLILGTILAGLGAIALVLWEIYVKLHECY